MNEHVVAVQRATLKDLNPYLTNILIVGAIIGKQKPRKFTDAKLNVHGVLRAVWNFTLRDSVKDYINVTYWGSAEVIFQANDKFNVGDVVALINPIIKIRNLDDISEQFLPMVTSPYSLTLTEKSTLIRHEANVEYFSSLLKFPTKPLAGFVPLRDIHNRGSSIQGYVNILVVVKGLSEIRNVSSRNNNETYTIRTVDVFDHTSPSLKLEIWENHIIQRSEHWIPKQTVLFITDLKIQWSNFQRQFIARITGCTIITENPNGREAQMLLNYAKDAPIETYDIVDQIINSLPDPNLIQNVMNVKQIHDKLNDFNGEIKHFTAVLYTFISNLDLDGLSKTLSIKCGKCKMEMKSSRCVNSECPTVFENETADPEFNFDIKLTLTDHTGSLKNCRLSGHPAEQALGCTAREFSNMSDDEKGILKWKYLLERCAVYIAVIFVGRKSPIISILKISLTNSLEVSRRLAVY
ncbi:meiosis-specific with OB domain-containing protein [Diorhabda carinulata]|uniref:meiosis-specific with OB domain-containing protein n=1 Tax=Diorhabda carinulata TaxID=1163345 RepID=UPI0025A21C47|nr:meiosis-specific with OB domain-containing protein [Diorhabda carinulata]